MTNYLLGVPPESRVVLVANCRLHAMMKDSVRQPPGDRVWKTAYGTIVTGAPGVGRVLVQ